MDDSQRLFGLLHTFIQQLPILLMLLGGILFALVRWKRHPKVSLLLIVSLLLLLIHTVVFTAVYAWVPGWFVRQGAFEPSGSIQTVMIVLGLIYNTTLAVVFILLLVSIFMQRKTRATGQV